MFWTSLVVTAGGVTAFTITGLKVRDYEDQKLDAIDNSGGVITSGPNDNACLEADQKSYAPLQKVCSDGKSMATVTNVLVGVTAVAAIATGYFYYKGYVAPGKGGKKESGDQSKRNRRRQARGGQVIIAPTISTDGAGLGAVVTF